MRKPKATVSILEADEAAASLAAYIAEMAEEMAQLAERSELTMLAYFLNLARVEAEFRSRELAAPPPIRSRAGPA